MQTEWQTVYPLIRLLLYEQGAVWSGSALFAQAYLPENLGSLRYEPTHVILALFVLRK